MGKFIKLIGYSGNKIHINIDNIIYFCMPNGDKTTSIYTVDNDEVCVKETPEEILAKISEV